MENKNKVRISGRYILDEPEDTLNKKQKIKTILLIISALLFISGALIVPPDAEFLSKFKALNTFFIIWYIFAFLACGYVLFQNSKKYKFKQEMAFKDKPKIGFSRRTFWGIMLYVAALLGVTVFQAVFVFYSQHYVIIIIFVFLLLALGTGAAYGIINYLTLKDAVFVEDEVVIEIAKDEEAAYSESRNSANAESVSETETDSADDFYNDIKP